MPIPPAGGGRGGCLAVHGALCEETRSISLSFVEPLAPVTAVRVELLQGIRGANGVAVTPVARTFTTGR